MSAAVSLFRAGQLGVVLALVGIVLASESFAAVSVYYFHRTLRCSDCLLIEQMSADILQETFPRELADGRLAWRPTNLDLPENTHFVFAYDLGANQLVVARGETSLRDYQKPGGLVTGIPARAVPFGAYQASQGAVDATGLIHRRSRS